MADQVYRGNCHCGDYRYELTVPEITTATACTCLSCKKGGLLWLVPPPEAFKEVRNAGKLDDYENETLKHKFCAKCSNLVTGEHKTGPLNGQFAINVRMIQGVNPFKLSITTIETDSQDRVLPPLPPSGVPAKNTSSCICGAVRVELLVPFDEVEIKEDNCSSCVRLAYIGTYPNKDQVRLHGVENTSKYAPPPGNGARVFCKTCGIHLHSIMYGPPVSIFFSVPEERLNMILDRYAANMRLQPLNVRAFDNINLSDLKWEPEDEGTEGYVLDPEW